MKDALLETVTHARLRARQGDRAGAVKILKRVLQRKPFDPPAVHLLEQLMNPGGPVGAVEEESPDSRELSAGVTGMRVDQTEALRQKMSAIRGDSSPGETPSQERAEPEPVQAPFDAAEATEESPAPALADSEPAIPHETEELDTRLAAATSKSGDLVDESFLEPELPELLEISPEARRLGAWLRTIERGSGTQWG